jgi:uncharacterized cupin superfamily protein
LDQAAAPAATRANGSSPREPWRLDVTYGRHELCLLPEGEVRLTDAAGRTGIFRERNDFVIPAGFTGVREVPRPLRWNHALHDPA